MNTKWIILIILAGICTANAQTVEEILEKSAQAQLKGNDPAEIYSVHIKGTLTMPQGVVGNMEIFQKEGGKYLNKTSIPSIGMEVIQGCDGVDCYSVEPMLGPRMLKGQELANTLLEGDFQKSFNWKDAFSSYVLVGEEDVDGRPCYKVDLITKTGLELTNYYEKSTFLLRRTDTVVENEMLGKVTGKLYYDQYEEFEGILMPTQMTMEMISNRIVMNKSLYEFNKPMEDSIFAIPSSARNSPGN